MIASSWHKAQIALLLIAEERIGAPMRLDAEIARAREDAAFEALKGAVGGPR